MKKAILLLTLPFLFACSNEDNMSKNEVNIIHTNSEHRTTVNAKGKYENYFFATALNSTSQDVKGNVKYTLKDYGFLESEVGVVPATKEKTKIFYLYLETDKVINHTVLLKAEFIKE